MVLSKQLFETHFHIFIAVCKVMLKTNMGVFKNTYAFRGKGDQQFVTKPCKNIGICTVLRYEGKGGVVKNLEKLRAYFLNDPYTTSDQNGPVYWLEDPFPKSR
jgi:hypothetical protein